MTTNKRLSAKDVLDIINTKDFTKVQNECFYDWFCKDTSLLGKTRKLSAKFKSIANSPKLDLTKMAIHFKNNCPCVGRLYDDIRISDLEKGHNIYVIIPSSGHNSNLGEAEVYHRGNWEVPVAKGTWEDVLIYFNGDSKTPKKVKEPKEYTVITQNDTRKNTVKGTLDYLISYFGYTLEIGNSHKPSIKREPKTIASFINNLQKAYAVKEARLYNRTYVELAI